MRFAAIFPLVFAVSVFLAVATQSRAFAAASSPDRGAEFKSGIAAFQKGDFEQARKFFVSMLQTDQTNPVALYDLGLTEQRAGRNGLALGLWRKALATHPGFAPPEKAVHWQQARLEHGDIPHEVESWESFRKVALVPYSLDTFLAAGALLLVGGGWTLLAYFGRRRQARLDEKPNPSFPVSATLCSFCFVIAFALAVAKIVDMQVIRGTVTEKKIEVRSSPDAGGTPLFDLYEGLEVVVQQKSGDWVQVTYPGGSTGWIPKTALFATTDKVAP
jgi:hypothetical protein